MEEGELVHRAESRVLSDLKIVFHRVAGQPGLKLDLSSNPIAGVNKGLQSLTWAW